ncbi:restriction endonuclease, partial [Limosilactobacillus reuteri]
FINNDESPINLNYEILAAVAFSLKKNGSLIKFNTLEDLYFKIRRQYIESQRNPILPHNINVEGQNVEDQYEALYSNKNNLTRSFNYEFDELNPFELEEKVALLYEILGYKSEATKKSGDQGADVIIVDPKTGIKSVIQIKKYTSKVSNSAIQQVIAAKAFYNAQEAIVMTTNYFTKSAIDLAENTGVILYDRDQFSAFISRVYKL